MDANQKCNDCSMPALDIVVCKACANQCHKGHSLETIGSRIICRCLHIPPSNTSIALNFMATRSAVGLSSIITQTKSDNQGICRQCPL